MVCKEVLWFDIGVWLLYLCGMSKLEFDFGYY